MRFKKNIKIIHTSQPSLYVYMTIDPGWTGNRKFSPISG